MVEVLDLEYSLDQDKQPDSVAEAVRSASRELEKSCGSHANLNLKKCHDFLIIEVKAGSDHAVHLLLDSLLALKTTTEKIEALKILTQMNRPPDSVFQTMTRLFRQESDPLLKGNLILSVTSLATQPTVTPKTKNFLYGVLLQELEKTGCNDLYLTDVFEAFGNLGDRSIVPKVIAKTQVCSSEPHLVAAIHSTRKVVHDKVVKNWFMHLLVSPATACVIKQEVITTLAEAASLHPPRGQEWP